MQYLFTIGVFVQANSTLAASDHSTGLGWCLSFAETSSSHLTGDALSTYSVERSILKTPDGLSVKIIVTEEGIVLSSDQSAVNKKLPDWNFK